MGLRAMHTVETAAADDRDKDEDTNESEQAKVSSPVMTSTTSRALLHVQDREEPLLLAGLLLYGNGVGESSSSSLHSNRPATMPEIGPVPESAVLSRLRSFLPEMQQANQRLMEAIDRQSRDAFNIEVLTGGNNTMHVEMDLALGIAELRNAEVVAVAERLVNGGVTDRHRVENNSDGQVQQVGASGSVGNLSGLANGIRGLHGGGVSLLNGIGNGVIWEGEGGSSSSLEEEDGDDGDDGDVDGDEDNNSDAEGSPGGEGDRESESESGEEEEHEQEEEEEDDDEDDGSDDGEEDDDGDEENANEIEGSEDQHKEQDEVYSDAGMDGAGNLHLLGKNVYGNGTVKHDL